MKFRFEKKSLENLYTKGSGKEKYPKGIVKAFLRAVRRIQAAQDERDLRSFKGQRLEKIKNQYSIRLNKGWRLMLRFERDHDDKIVVIIEVNNHYDD